MYGTGLWKVVYIPFPEPEGWRFRRPITIDNTTNTNTLTDYQVLITLDTASLISAGKMRSDCGDIRFKDTDGTSLNYWIEPGTENTSSTKIWVKVPNIPGSSTKTIYMYYGNLSATSESNATNTFIRVIDGVVGSWHFDEGSGTTAYDTSGNDNDGTIYGATWTDGKFGKALSFDGVDDYVEVPDSDSLDLQTLTLEVWNKLDALSDTGVLYKRSGLPGSLGTNANYQMEIYPPGDGNYYFAFSYRDGSSWQNVYSTNTPIETGKWYHVVMTFDSGTGRVYINGKLDAEKTGLPSLVTNDYHLVIGAAWNDYFNGIIDEVRIYNRALTPEEISDLYNNYGYTTENYPGYVLVRKFTDPEPSTSVGSEEIYGISKILLA